MVVLSKDNFNSEIESYEGLAVIDLYADWCGPCRMLAPIIEELESEYPTVKFCKVNVDKEPELASLFKVTSIPHVAVVKNNNYVDFSLGYVPKDKLRALIEEYK